MGGTVAVWDINEILKGYRWDSVEICPHLHLMSLSIMNDCSPVEVMNCRLTPLTYSNIASFWLWPSLSMLSRPRGRRSQQPGSHVW